MDSIQFKAGMLTTCSSLYNTGWHNKNKFVNSLMQHKYNKYTVIYIQINCLVHLPHVVGTFISKVPLLHILLWSCVLLTQNTVDRCVQQLDMRCSDGDRSLWAQQSFISRCLASLTPIFSISFSCNQTLARSSLKPSWISMALILTLFPLGRSSQ